MEISIYHFQIQVSIYLRPVGVGGAEPALSSRTAESERVRSSGERWLPALRFEPGVLGAETERAEEGERSPLLGMSTTMVGAAALLAPTARLATPPPSAFLRNMPFRVVEYDIFLSLLGGAGSDPLGVGVGGDASGRTAGGYRGWKKKVEYWFLTCW